MSDSATARLGGGFVMDVDQNAVTLASQIMRHYEGCEKKLSNGRIGPYLDTAKVATIGWGNTRWQDGPS